MMIGNYTRVTEILSPFSGIQYVNKDVLAKACDRGTRVHKACEAIIQGFGDWETDPDLRPYIDSFNKWMSLIDRKFLSIEERFHDDEMMITGAVDLIEGYPDGECRIIDLKTSAAPSKTWLLQGSAYSYMAKKAGYLVKEICFVKLDKTGGIPKLYYYDENMDLFRKTLDVYNYFYRKKNAKIDHDDI